MKLHHYLYHLLAMVGAYGLVLLVPMLVDFAFGSYTELSLILWLTIGIGVMHAKKVRYPTPDMHSVDVRGGLRVLWWALFWPRYLSGK